MRGFDREQRPAFMCPKCGGLVMLRHEPPGNVVSLPYISYTCVECEDWIDVDLDENHVYGFVKDFEEYATNKAVEYFEMRA